jgi:Uncharacterised protein family (UPF0236)
MAAHVIPMFGNEALFEVKEDWKAPYLSFVSRLLEELLEGFSMDKLSDITSTLFSHKADLLGQMVLTFIRKRHGALLEQEQCHCPECDRVLTRRAMHKRQVETLAGRFELERPYFYCTHCSFGRYPLDEALGLSPATKQDDVQSVGVWLASKLPYEEASETFERCTGIPFSAHSLHQSVNRVAEGLGVLDVCPSRAEVEEKIARIGKGKRWRPVMMMTVDGAQEPVRPEPSPRKGKRGKGDWKEAKGFRFYLLDGDRIHHLISWHQIGSNQEIAEALKTIKEAGLVPEEKVRLCVVADGADWIWNRTEEIFASARQVLDFYHCSEYLHAVAAAQYGKRTEQAQEWVHATLVRLSLNEENHAIAGLKRMKPSSTEAEKLIENAIIHLTKHSGRLNYASARRGGFHIGSGAIESANKMICHVRLKRTGAWWYPSCANRILKIRCAKYNGTYDRVMELYRQHHPIGGTRRRRKQSTPGTPPAQS